MTACPLPLALVCRSLVIPHTRILCNLISLSSLRYPFTLTLYLQIGRHCEIDLTSRNVGSLLLYVFLWSCTPEEILIYRRKIYLHIHLRKWVEKPSSRPLEIASSRRPVADSMCLIRRSGCTWVMRDIESIDLFQGLLIVPLFDNSDRPVIVKRFPCQRLRTLKEEP